MWKCNVLNCGGGECVHQLTEYRCPICGSRLVRNVKTAFWFCSNHEAICDYETDFLTEEENA